MNGVQAMALSLTTKLHKGFFEVSKYPESTFTSTSIEHGSREGDPPGTNCVVEGNFQLKDITRSIKIPMHLEAGEGKVQLTSKFKLNRKDYGVVYPESILDEGIRDDVLLEISIDSTFSAREIVVVERVTNQKHENYTDTINVSIAEFDMVAVPGDKEKGIKPFFIGKNEVTWNEFDYWALCKGLTKKEKVNQVNKLLRPSQPHDVEKIYRGWGGGKQPVVGVSRLSAELYCNWLSAQTGRTYRLPTAEEWEHAYVLGGEALDEVFESEELLKKAWFEQNGILTDDEGFDLELAMQVGQLNGNKLGIHDMLGNAAEWVSGKEHVVRGGHFKLSADELSGSHREVENLEVWKKADPQSPKSNWWYASADYIGFRVVCELE